MNGPVFCIVVGLIGICAAYYAERDRTLGDLNAGGFFLGLISVIALRAGLIGVAIKLGGWG